MAPAIAFWGEDRQIAAMSDLNDTSTVLRLLETRKSASAKAMTGPGPSASDLDRILACAVRVPDHGKLAPWRFLLW